VFCSALSGYAELGAVSPSARIVIDSTQHGELMKVTVIVPTYKDTLRLSRCVAALVAQTVLPKDYEILVVDNEGSAEVKALCDRYPGRVDYLLETAPGSYAARNRGLARATGELVAFTDSDCIPAADWLEHGVKALNSSSAPGIVGGRIDVFPDDPERVTLSEAYDMMYAFRHEVDIIKHGKVVTANCFTRRSIFEHVGLFNSQLMSGGDVEWSGRVRRAGYPLAYDAAAVVLHPARNGVAGQLAKVRRTTAGQAAVYRADKSSWPSFRTSNVCKAFVPPLRRVIRDSIHERTALPLGVRVKAGCMLLIRHYYKLLCVLYYKSNSRAVAPRV